MIRISTEEKHSRYLVYSRYGPDRFTPWLKKIGIDKLPYGLTPVDFMEQGWITPTLRVDLPDSYFLSWKNYPFCPAEGHELPEEDKWCKICDIIEWDLPFQEPGKEWFLHPYDRTEGGAEKYKSHGVPSGAPIPPEQNYSNGRLYSSCYLYFSHWHIYQFLDLVEHINLCGPVPNLPNAPELIKQLNEQYATFKKFSDINITAVSKKWGRWRSTFDLISYYRTLRSSLISLREDDPAVQQQRLSDGAKELAIFLSLEPEKLEAGIKDHLLVLFQEWQWAIQQGSLNYQKPTGFLRKDIYYAVDWLCRLTGENFETYFKKWRYTDRNQREWAQLEDALPYEYIEEKAHFLQMVPRYLVDFDKHISRKQRITNQQLEEIVEKLWHEQDNFKSFCRAFRQLHNHLSSRDNEEIDFRSFAVLDYFLLLAIRGEVLLADILDHAGHGRHSLKLKQIIEKFITVLPQHSIWIKGINSSLSNWKQLTNLEDKPDDPFIRIQTGMDTACKEGPAREFAIQLLTFGMMRNYFAHHTYFDDRLLAGKTGRSGLVSILVVVIYLAAYTNNKK